MQITYQSNAAYIEGGTGTDIFYFSLADDGGDTFADFTVGQDAIGLSHTGFGVSGTGHLTDAHVQFVLGGTAVGSGPELGNDASQGIIWWDADTAHPEQAVILAYVTGSSAIKAGSFYFFRAGRDRPAVVLRATAGCLTGGHSTRFACQPAAIFSS